MKNFIQHGRSINYTVPSGGVLSGAIVVMGGLAGVATTDGAENDVIAVNLVGVYDLPKVSGAVTVGQALYYNTTEKKVTTTQSTNDLVGYATEAAISGATSVPTRLKQ